MVSLLVSFFTTLFRRKPAPTVQEPPKPTGFDIEHEWPFPSPKPNNTDALILELIRGVETRDGHAFYFWEGQKRRHLRTPDGKETILARHIVWWMEGRKLPQGASNLVTTCGEQKCIKLSHLIVKPSTIMLGPEKPVPAKEPQHVVRKPQKPVKPEKLDRTKCPTAKGYFATQGEARHHSSILNRKEIRGKGKRVYPYDTACPYCLGWHLTSMKPGAYQKVRIKNSAY